jgi:deazaflavin-dependent oxidoreductase (nitroreductase family)
MSDAKVTMTEVERANLGVIDSHCRAYLESGGREGHIFDTSSLGGHNFLTTLLIETFGRKTGQRRIIALNYGDIGGEVAIVASKGGADVHPAWYLNLVARPELIFQIATQAFRATWREPAGAEHDKVWDFMVDAYPPYAAYRAGTQRAIPIILLKPFEPVAVLQP